MSYILDELWKQIEGYEGLYEISNYGQVRTRKNQILKANIINGGYEQVSLYSSSQKKSCLVHRLVAQAFIPNPKDKPQVNHIDGNKRNNAVTNLEWTSAKENMKHSVENNIRTDIKPVDMFSASGEFIRTFPSISTAGKEMGIPHNNISRCCRKRYGYKTAGGYVWDFHEKGCAV